MSSPFTFFTQRQSWRKKRGQVNTLTQCELAMLLLNDNFYLADMKVLQSNMKLSANRLVPPLV